MAGFSETILSAGYDQKAPTPHLHVEMWDMAGSDVQNVAIAAPRDHAKSTAITHAYCLAEVAFRREDFVIILSDTEEQAAEFLSDIRLEIEDNEALQDIMGFVKFLRTNATDIIVLCSEGHQFRILAKGAEQKLRGKKWRHRRPGLIIADDLENDEAVVSLDRREKFQRWFFSACKPALRKGGRIRVVGTILHEDSLLSRLMRNDQWTSKLYKAHRSFDDYSDLLWPEHRSEKELRKYRQECINEGKSDLYSQEILNDPFDHSGNFFRRSDFLPLDIDDRSHVVYYAGADFAISEKERADNTAFKVISVNAAGRKRLVHSVKGHMDSLEIMEAMFTIHEDYHPEMFFVESDKIEKAIGPFLYKEMRKRDVYINLEKKVPTKSKRSRAKPMQAEMRAHNVEFDMEAEWWPGFQQEMLRFDKGTRDDDVDSLGIIFLGLNELDEGMTEEEEAEEEYYNEYGSNGLRDVGRCDVTGY